MALLEASTAVNAFHSQSVTSSDMDNSRSRSKNSIADEILTSAALFGPMKVDDTDYLHLVICNQSGSELDNEHRAELDRFKSKVRKLEADEYDGIENLLEGVESSCIDLGEDEVITQDRSIQSDVKITAINDVNRIIKKQAKHFQTTFIRYRAKEDQTLAKETQGMLINLDESGVEILANFKNI